MDGLQVGAAVVEDDLGCEVEESSRLWVEFKCQQSKWFAGDQAEWRVGVESLGRVLKHFEYNWSVAGVGQGDCLVHRLKGPTRLEV